MKGVIGGRRGAPGRGEGRKVWGTEGKSRDKLKNWIGQSLRVEWSWVRQGLCNSSIIKVFKVHESPGFVNIIDNSSLMWMLSKMSLAER